MEGGGVGGTLFAEAFEGEGGSMEDGGGGRGGGGEEIVGRLGVEEVGFELERGNEGESESGQGGRDDEERRIELTRESFESPTACSKRSLASP